MPDDAQEVSTTPVARYTARSGLRVRALGDDLLVFHPASWDVHLLNPAASVVLDACIEAPQTLDSAAALLREVLSNDLLPSATTHAHHVIHELADLGLICRLAT